MLTKELETVVEALTAAGGKPYVVGGAVRDMILGKQPKDLDVEVYGLAAEEIVSVLKKFGRVDQVGVSFGVIKLKIGKNEYDISLPRRESKAGTGHRGFVVKPDPTMTLQEACARRDFTINAMAYCPVEKKVIDYYGGQEDMKNKILRHTSPAFAEDPLRVLRGFQFAGRLGMVVANETVTLCRELKAEFSTLAKERIWGEWEKWALKSISPSYGLEALHYTGWAECFGISVTHGMLYRADDAVRVATENGLSADERIVLVLAAVCTWQHPDTVEALVVEKLGAPLRYRDKLVPLCRWYRNKMEPQYLTDKGIRCLAVELAPATIKELGWLLSATGSPGVEVLEASAVRLGALNGKVKPILMGKHLIEAGPTPGPEMGRILKSVYEAQLDGSVVDLSGALALARSLQTP